MGLGIWAAVCHPPPAEKAFDLTQDLPMGLATVSVTAVDMSAHFLFVLPWWLPPPKPPALFLGAPAPRTPRFGGLPPLKSPVVLRGGGGGGAKQAQVVLFCLIATRQPRGG